MNILLTGGNGMVGKNILEHAGAASHALLAPSSAELNLLDGAAVAAWLAAHRPDMVIHCAGVVGGIQANMAEPVRFLVDNMQMGLNLITAARAAGVGRLMNLSSSCMYPRAAANPLAEELILAGELEPTNEGYALAKIASTRLCEYIRKEEPALLYKTVIPCNIYGRHDKFDPKHSHMIPAVIKKIVDAKLAGRAAIDIWGDGTARREFMYAGDLADFVFYAIDRFEAMPQNINVGLGHDYTINEYYAAVARTVGFDGAFEHDLSKPVGMKQKLIDDRKLAAFGWKYATSIADGIQQTYDYYMNEVRRG
ncbi:nucleoside-diphosphate-sugar epimerase [Janthinobacterium sp. CG_23.3]|uniref:NAD-dependent epimerase/dehydratase family protein n=1 Tax=Janthinobacterium sp. CG_23.3 TaxID=3349634 RepID=UPI0038D48C2B